jgi:hypothetical protein
VGKYPALSRGLFRAACFVLIGVLVPGCKDEKASDDRGTPFVSPMGYAVEFRGPVERAEWDHFPSDPAPLDRATALVALDAAVEQFIATHAVNPDTVRSVAREWRWVLSDDYVFGVHGMTGDFGYVDWAAGLTSFEGKYVQLAVYSRGSTANKATAADADPAVAGVPPNAPAHTVRPPGTYAFWRFGTEPLIPAVSYELENVFGLPHQ